MRLRFAPSPTGNLHIGTLWISLFNWVFAKGQNATLVLRIEDTDTERSKPEFEHNIFESLAWMGIEVDESPLKGGPYAPYRQSERIQQGLYKKQALSLVDQKKAYYCFCTDADLDQERLEAQAKKVPYIYSQKCTHLKPEDVQEKLNSGNPHTIRFKIPRAHTQTFKDLIRGEISFDMSLISDFVLVKSDGTPSYNFAVVVDDMSMAITHIIRGEDHISNTPRQLELYQAFGATPPHFAHLPLILGPDKSKLSKRHGATSVKEFKDLGYLNSALMNYLMLLGWSSPDGKELLNMADVIQTFSLERVSKSGAVFDLVKLKWMNGHYIRELNLDSLYAAVRPYMSEELFTKLSAMFTEDQIKLMAMSIRDNLDLLADINTYLAVYAQTLEEFKTQVSTFTFSEQDHKVLTVFQQFIQEAPPLTPSGIDQILAQVLESTQLGKGKVFKPIRLASSAMASGPHLPDFMSILGKESLLERLSFVSTLKAH